MYISNLSCSRRFNVSWEKSMRAWFTSHNENQKHCKKATWGLASSNYICFVSLDFCSCQQTKPTSFSSSLGHPLCWSLLHILYADLHKKGLLIGFSNIFSQVLNKKIFFKTPKAFLAPFYIKNQKRSCDKYKFFFFNGYVLISILLIKYYHVFVPWETSF